jgi:hypothetical protein
MKIFCKSLTLKYKKTMMMMMMMMTIDRTIDAWNTGRE